MNSQLVIIESSLEERIEQNNPVRIIDVFVDSCKLDEFGFTQAMQIKGITPVPRSINVMKWG